MNCFTKLLVTGLIGLSLTSCTNHKELKHYPISNMNDLIDAEGLVLDNKVSSDGNGALHITADTSKAFKLYETGDIDLENSIVTYQAYVKTKDIKGKVYIEMFCHFNGKGEFFSRSLNNTLSGTEDWTLLKTPFFLKKGENPDNIKLNLVVEGSGQLWVDDIRLTSQDL